MSWVLKIVERVDGIPTEHDGRYVVYFNPDNHPTDGREYDGGTLITARFAQHAHQFTTVYEALNYWKQPATCDCHAIRWDGKPNRPLTQYTCTTIEMGPNGV